MNVSKSTRPVGDLPRANYYSPLYAWMEEHLAEGIGEALVLTFEDRPAARRFQIAVRTNRERSGDLASLCQCFQVSLRGSEVWLVPQEGEL